MTPIGAEKFFDAACASNIQEKLYVLRNLTDAIIQMKNCIVWM